MNFRDFSSWREQTVKIKQGLNEIDFIDTKPNMFIIQNDSSYSLKVSLSRASNDENYEFEIPKTTTKPIGRPLPVGKIYIWLDANMEFSIKIYSIQDTFDIEILNSPLISLDGAEVKTDGLVKGFGKGVSLPTGNNNIGKVDIESISDSVKTFFNENHLEDINKWNNLMALETINNVTNLRNVVNGLEEVALNIQNLVKSFLKVETSISVNGAVISTGASNTTFSTNNWFDMWLENKNYCLKVNDFSSKTECEVSAQGYYNGTLEQKHSIAYFKLEVIQNDKVKLSVYNNQEESYPSKTYTMETITDASQNKYVTTHEVFNDLVDWLWSIYPPTIESEGYFKSINFSTTKQTYTYESESSQAYHTYSGAFANIPKAISIESEFNGIYTVNKSIGVNICSPIHTEQVPIKIMDKIEFISNLSDTKVIEITLYYSFGNYVKVTLAPNDYISDINMPIYNIGVKIKDFAEGDTANISLYGGLY